MVNGVTSVMSNPRMPVWVKEPAHWVASKPMRLAPELISPSTPWLNLSAPTFAKLLKVRKLTQSGYTQACGIHLSQ